MLPVSQCHSGEPGAGAHGPDVHPGVTALYGVVTSVPGHPRPVSPLHNTNHELPEVPDHIVTLYLIGVL